MYDLQILYTLNFSFELFLEQQRKQEHMSKVAQYQKFGYAGPPGQPQGMHGAAGPTAGTPPAEFETIDLEENPRFLKGFQHYMDLAAVIPDELLEDAEEIQERGRTAFSTGGEEGSLEAKVGRGAGRVSGRGGVERGQ